MASSKLPRVKHAPKPRPDEKVMRRSGADLNNGWLARGGHLRLHDDHLSFAPSRIERQLLARDVRVDIGQLRATARCT